MQEHILETTSRQPTLREAGEILQNYINTNNTVTTDKSRYNVGNTTMGTDELGIYLGQLIPYKGNYLRTRGISKQSINSVVFKKCLLYSGG